MSLLFFLSKLVGFLLQPSTVVLLLCLGGLPLLLSRRVTLGCRLLVCGAIGFLLIAWSPLGDRLMLPLEERFPRPANAPEKVDGIVVLGGAVDPAVTEERGIPALNGAAERMTSFAALARRYPEAKLLFTGGDGTLVGHRLSEADVAKALFTELGIPESRLSFERRSRNTYENVLFSREIMQPKPGETWILVTSAAHMPRSVALFRQAGWPILPWPVGYKSTPNLGTWYNFSVGQRIDVTDSAVREWIGLVAYRLLGRTGEILPAP